MSVFSAILIILLCDLLYKYRKSLYKSSTTGILNIASEGVELVDNPLVYNMIDDNQLENLMHDQANDMAIASEGTQRLDRSDNDLTQYDESEYLHPYHSLVPSNDTSKQDYEQIRVQNNEDVCVYNDTGCRLEQIRTLVYHLSENTTSNCTSDDLTRIDLRKHFTYSKKNASDPGCHENQPDQNNQFELFRVVTNVTHNANPISDNIFLD